MKSFFGICVLSALVTVGTTQPTNNSPRVEQTQHHTPPEPHIRQPYHYINQPQHGYDSWSTAQARAQTQSQPTWISHDQPVETFSQPHIMSAQPHTIHSQPQPIDPQFELHPYPYQHPHYPPTGSHRAQDNVYPTHGLNSQNPAGLYQDPLPEASAPEHHLNSYKKDYPDQFSAVASAVPSYSSNSVPISHQPANPQVYKIISISKADDAADYILPVADHETRLPRVVHTSNYEDLPDIVQEILAKYRHIPASLGPVNRPHRHKTHKVPTIPVETKLSAKVKAVAKTGNDKTVTIINGGKHSTSTKAPLNYNHKHSHKKVLNPLLDPQLLAKEFHHLSKVLRVPLPDKTHEKDIPCDDDPIVTDDRTNSDDADDDNLLDSVKNKPINKNQHKKHATPKKDTSEKTTTPSAYIEPYDKKDVVKDIDRDSASLDETTKPCEDDNTPEKEDKRRKQEQKPIINEKNTNSKPLDPKIRNNDFKEKKVEKKEEVKKEPKFETKSEEIKEPSETKKYDGKQNQKKDQKHTDKDNDQILANRDEITEPCDDINSLEKENERKKHVPKNKIDDKQAHDSEKKNTNPKPVDPITENNDLKEKEVVQKKDAKKEITKTAETKKKENIEQSPKYVPETKIYDGKQNLKNDQKDNDRVSAYSDKTTEPCDTYNAPEKEDNTKNLQLKPDDKHYTDKPVHKGNIDTITDHKVVEKKKVKEDVPRKVETEKEKAQKQSKKTKPQPETYDAKQKPVEHDTPVSDEDSLIQVPNDKIPAPEHKKELKKPFPKDNYKRVRPDTDKEKKDIITAKQDAEKVEQAKEITGKVETKKEDNQTLKNEPEPKKYEDKLKPDKQENKSSDIEDCDSTESNEPQRPLDKSPAPEYKRELKELKEPLAKANKDKSEALDKSKSVETSTENSDMDDGDSADSETHPKLDITNTEMQDAKNKKAEEVNKGRVTIAKNKAEGTGEELTSDEVAKILEKTETDQPLSTIGFLISLISHALQGSDSVREMFEEPKVKSFIEGIIPLFHEKQKDGIVSDYA